MMHFDFNLGAYIQGKDEHCGRLAGLVIDPEARQVTDLIVDRGLMTQKRVLPIAVVQSALEENIYVSISSYELDRYPEYRVIEYEEPVTGLERSAVAVATPYGLQGASEPTVPTVQQKIHEGIASGRQVIERGMPVNNVDGKIGKMARVVVNRERQEITCLVMRRGMIFAEQFVIPISMVENMHEDGILVTGTDEALEHLPHYKHAVEADLLTK